MFVFFFPSFMGTVWAARAGLGQLGSFVQPEWCAAVRALPSTRGRCDRATAPLCPHPSSRLLSPPGGAAAPQRPAPNGTPRPRPAARPPLTASARRPERLRGPRAVRPCAERSRACGRRERAGRRRWDAVAEENADGALEAGRGAGEIREEGDQPAAPQ